MATLNKRNGKRIRILIVDDHDMLREGLVSFMKAFPDIEVVGEAVNGTEAIQRCLVLDPDVVLMDLVMPETDGAAAIQTIRKECPNIKFIALSSFGGSDLVQSALKAGATSYLLKNISADHLADAIRSAASGFSTLAPEVTELLLAPKNASASSPVPYALTKREQEVLQLLVDGLANADIALQLNISKYTVKNYVSNLLGKLAVASRTEAVSLALKEGLIQAD